MKHPNQAIKIIARAVVRGGLVDQSETAELSAAIGEDVTKPMATEESEEDAEPKTKTKK